jgi:hypothetical protein
MHLQGEQTLAPNKMSNSQPLHLESYTPGYGHVPLLPGSPAINAGNDEACPETDQLGQHRVEICDIGAVEFQGTAVSSR